jgi:hypothetical protein
LAGVAAKAVETAKADIMTIAIAEVFMDMLLTPQG